MVDYAVRVVESTRIENDLLDWGAGPRASSFLILAAKARAITNGKPTPDIHDIKKIVKTCLKLNLFNKTIIIANNTMYSLVNLINKIELILQKKAIIIKSKKFNNKSFVINVKSYKKLYQKSKVTFGKNYLTEKLNKYYK